MTKQLDLDAVFHALSNQTRRELVQTLVRGSSNLSELGKPIGIAAPTLLQHLRVLESAQIIRSDKQGRVRTYTLDPSALVTAEHWMETRRREWSDRCDRIDALAISLKENENQS